MIRFVKQLDYVLVRPRERRPMSRESHVAEGQRSRTMATASR
jgi:hypothetical protein